MKNLLTNIVLLLVFTSNLKAQTKPVLSVSTKIDQEVIPQNFYSKNKLDEICADISDSLIVHLTEYFKMYYFVSEEVAFDTILFVLKRDPRSVGNVDVDTQIEIVLTGRNVLQQTIKNEIDFKKGGAHEEYLYLDGIKLKKEIIRYILGYVRPKQLSNQNYIFTNDLFQYVSVADTVEMIDFAKDHWKLPYTYNDLGISTESVFKISTLHSADLTKNYRSMAKTSAGKILTVVHEDPKQMGYFDKRIPQDSITYRDIKGIYILEYTLRDSNPSSQTFQ